MGQFESFSSIRIYSRSPPGLSLSRPSRPGPWTFTRTSSIFTSELEPGPACGTRFRVLSCCESEMPTTTRAIDRSRRGRNPDVSPGETSHVPCRFYENISFRSGIRGRVKNISEKLLLVLNIHQSIFPYYFTARICQLSCII